MGVHDRHAKANIKGWIERSAKYTNSWPKRYCSFAVANSIFAYGENEGSVKSTMQVQKILRSAELVPNLKKGSPDLLVILLEGRSQKEKDTGKEGAEGKEEQWAVRMPDEDQLNQWYEMMRDSLAARGQMEPTNGGLPRIDPRLNLEFARIPLEHLNTFGLLEKAVVYYFGPVTMLQPVTGAGSQLASATNFFTIGDTRIYVFLPTANVLRCFHITLIDQLFVNTEGGFIGIKCLAPQHDMLIRSLTKEEIQHIVEVLTLLYKIHSPNQARDIIVETVSEAAETIVGKLNLNEREGYELQMVSPLPKTRLKQALIAFKADHGFEYHAGVVVPNTDRSEPKEPSHDPDLDINDPMTMLLMRLNLKQYIQLLRKQHIDIDMLTCMEPDDLAAFGVQKADHRVKMCEGAGGNIRASLSPPPQHLPRVPGQQQQQQPQQPQQRQAQRPSLSPDLMDSFDFNPVQNTKPRKTSIHLDDDDDDLPPPVRAGATAQQQDDADDLDISPPIATASSKGHPTTGPMILDDNSDDDLFPVVQRVVKLDDDDI